MALELKLRAKKNTWKHIKPNLEEFTIANVAGYGTFYRKKTLLYATYEEIIYNFIVKLSDLKI